MKVSKVSDETLQYLSTSAANPKSTRSLAKFTIEMIGNKQDLYSMSVSQQKISRQKFILKAKIQQEQFKVKLFSTQQVMAIVIPLS